MIPPWLWIFIPRALKSECFSRNYMKKKTILCMLKDQIYRFRPSLLNYQENFFSKIRLFYFLVFMAKCSHEKNQENSLSNSWEKRITDRRTDGRAKRRNDRQMELFRKNGCLISKSFQFILLAWKKFNLNFLKYFQQRLEYRSKISLREKCPYLELFWSAFSRIRTEYRKILRISLYSVQLRENEEQNNF